MILFSFFTQLSYSFFSTYGAYWFPILIIYIEYWAVALWSYFSSESSKRNFIKAALKYDLVILSVIFSTNFKDLLIIYKTF